MKQVDIQQWSKHPRKYRVFAGCVLCCTVTAFSSEAPAIVSFQPSGALTWTNSTTNGIATIQTTQQLGADPWKPAFYDVATNALTTVMLPPTGTSSSLYRVAVSTNIPDPSLVLYLPFDNDFRNSGQILDVSGYGNHALRYSLTNWPSPIKGPDGSVAAGFHHVGTYEGGGDYAGIPWTTNSPFYRLTNGTLLVWAYYTTNSYGASAIIDGSSYYNFPYSWFLGRDYSYSTRFDVYVPGGSFIRVVVYPDDSNPTYDSSGWHYYGVTWDGANFIGYYNGTAISTNSQAGIPALTLGGDPWAHWIAVGCMTHDGTPQIDGDGYPNNAWIDGGIDDFRLYNRALSAGEIQSLYQSMNKVTPATRKRPL
jgi:hypothetical protein